MTNLNTMGQHTHHLPKHLGTWPCTIDDGPDQYDRVTVIYEANGATHELRLDAGILTPIRPDEPSTPFAADHTGHIWENQEPGWSVYGGTTTLDWPTLWDRHGPIRPLVEVPAVTVPFHLVGALDNDQIRVTWMANPVIIRTVVEGKYESQSADLTPDEAELFAAALLDAARKAGAYIAAKLAPGYEAFIEKAQQGMAEFGEHTAETDRPLATGGIVTGNPPYVINETPAGTFVKGPPADPAKPFWDGAFVTGDRFSHLPGEGDQR